MAVTEAAFAPTSHTFTICMEVDSDIQAYIEYSPDPDFTRSFGSPDYGFDTADGNPVSHLVEVSPAAGGPGDLIYWRLRTLTSGNYVAGTTRTVRLSRPRTDDTGWNFVVGGSCKTSGTGDISDNAKAFGIPTAMGLNPDFIIIPGDLTNSPSTVATAYEDARESFNSYGLTVPVFLSPGDREEEATSAHRARRLEHFPCAGIAHNGVGTTRAPFHDCPFQERTKNSNAGSYYSFAWGNALFVCLNDFDESANARLDKETTLGSLVVKLQQKFVEQILNEHRHKYKWCFTFSHTSVDEDDPSGASPTTLAEDASSKAWLEGIHSDYKVTAHFSSHYRGWRTRMVDSTLYVNCVLGAAGVDSSSGTWVGENAMANIQIGRDENGAINEDKCKIDIVHCGANDSSGHEQGEILDTKEVEVFTGTINDWKNEAQLLPSSNKRKVLIEYSENWLINDRSGYNDEINILVDQFFSREYVPLLYDSSLAVPDKTFVLNKAPFIFGPISVGYINNYHASNLTTSTSLTAREMPLPWQDDYTILDGVSTSAPTPVYLIKDFDVPTDIDVEEIELNHSIDDAAYVWINGILAWYSDGAGRPIGTPSGNSYAITSRPELDPEKVDPNSANFASSSVVANTEPSITAIDQSTYPSVVADNSRRHSPEINYGLGDQPIRINNIDVISSLRKSGNKIAVMWVQGRDNAASAGQSEDSMFDLQLIAVGKNANDLFSPQIQGPTHASQFNRGEVEISWNVSNPPSTNPDISKSFVSYEIEYTDNYTGATTNWHTLKRRIPWSQTSYTWNVGKMIKSSSVRIRMRARSGDTEQVSKWSYSGEFAINVFDLIPPAIVNPLPRVLYTDFILIVLDESLVRNTFNQKVRYTLEYSSEKRSISWTAIQSNVPVGKNVIRWNIEDVPTSDDYILRLTARNASTCLEATESTPDQIARRYVHGINIQQSGMFLIDTKPPEAVLQIENTLRATNQLQQIVNIFAEDATTKVTNVQLRECLADGTLSLGDLEDPYDPYGGCTPIEDLLSGDNVDLNNLIGKPVGDSTKIEWVFDDESGLRKLEAMLTDAGGNTSLQDLSKIFLSAFDSSNRITDFILSVEQRDKVTIDDTTVPASVDVVSSVFEVVYLGTTNGEFWSLEPFGRLLFAIDNNPVIEKIAKFNDAIYLFTYDSTEDEGKCYRNDVNEATLLQTFTTGLSQTTSVAEFDSNLYIGFTNGELWLFDGFTFTLVETFTDSINTLFGDKEYLYIGFQNSANLVLYNGSTFSTLDIS